MSFKKSFFWFFLFLTLSSFVSADQTLSSFKTEVDPILDGVRDPAWEKAAPIVTHDTIADIDITLRSLHTDTKIFFLVTFPDADESRIHKNWVWDSDAQMYRKSRLREDMFVFKWNMTDALMDLSIYADDDYNADIWFWKACRTDPAGYADDKIQILNMFPIPKATKLTSKLGKTTYLQRLGDEGKPAYRNRIFIDYVGDEVMNFESQMPQGSRADIQAKGSWGNGQWTIEFSRDLDTDHEDDIIFDLTKEYQFGVSRYEMAGRDIEEESSQPLYGTGDISESLMLKFINQ